MSNDLFEDSTMTFGEHLEELRTHLWRAIQGVLICLLLMLAFGQYVVQAITEPVKKELKAYKDQRLSQTMQKWKDSFPEDLPQQIEMSVTIPRASVVQMVEDLGGSAPQPDAAPADEKPVSVIIQTPTLELINQLGKPLLEATGQDRLRTFATQEAFMMYFKASLGAAIVLASPWVFYQLYSFIAVGLYAHERRFVTLSLPFSVLLFLSGVALCYFIIFPFMLKFFLGANSWMDLEPEIRLNEWVGFAVMITLIFGIMFQLPLLMLTLERVGIVNHEMLAGKRKMVIFGMFVMAAIITPADPTTQVALAIPMCLLFELGLLLMRYFQRRNPFAVADPTAEEEFF